MIEEISFMAKISIGAILGGLGATAALAATVYFGYIRNEDRCYDKLEGQLESLNKQFAEWRQDQPSWLDYTELELAQIGLKLKEEGLTLLSIRSDPYRHVCDYYVYEFSLKEKSNEKP